MTEIRTCLEANRFGRRAMMGLIVTIVLFCVSESARAQQCPGSTNCNAVVLPTTPASAGEVVLGTLSTDAPNRVVHAEQASPDGLFTDEMIGLTYNRSWNPETGFARDDATLPSTWLGLESYWNGNMELNIDISAPNSMGFVRPLGFDAAYNGANAQLQIGGPPYGAGAAGVILTGGTGELSSLLTMRDQSGRTSYSNMLDMMRQDGTDSFAWRAGGVPRLEFALQSNLNAAGFGNFGVMKFAGEWDYGEPIIDFQSVGTDAILLQSAAGSTDAFARFMLLGSGTAEWGPGTAAPDTNLYRSAASTLRTDGNLVVGGDLAVMGQKAALVSTASYGQREVYAVESPGEWFEDFGNATVASGRAIVPIDRVFAETVNTQHEYHVFLTPNGRCALYIADKQPMSFTVKRLSGARRCPFEYRIVARRRGYENVRAPQLAVTQTTAY